MKRSVRFLLSVSSGILLSLSWLGFPGWTLFFAFVPLLYLDHFFVEQKENYRGVSFFGHALVAVTIWNVSTTFWVANATLVGALLAFTANSFFMSLVWWLIHWTRRRFKSNLGYFALIGFWITFEFLHYHWDIEWPWLQLGNGFANNIKMVQWYEYTGVFGGTLWVLIMNILLFKILRNFLNKSTLQKSFYPVTLFVLLLIIPLSLSLQLYHTYSSKEDPRNIVIVQPNIDPYSEEYGLEAETVKLNTFIKLAQSKANDSTDFIIGPETVFESPGYWKESQLSSNRFLRQLDRMLQQYRKAELVFGVSSIKIYPNIENATPTARIQGDIAYDRFNTAIFLDRKGETQIYHKSKLVVGVEKMPFSKYLGFIKDIVINIGGTTGSLGRQTEPSNFTAKDGIKVAPVICYESIFGEYITGYVKKGAGLIFIITNDGWWKNTPGYRQHMSFARLRAIETRRSIARSANTGISCFINQRGDVSQPTGWWKEAAISGTLHVNDKITFYVKYGDYIARVSVFLSVLLILSLIVRVKVKG